jgi:hypothetical protein
VNHPLILGIGTSNPPDRLTQEQTFHAAGYQSERIRKIFLNSDIDYRHFYGRYTESRGKLRSVESALSARRHEDGLSGDCELHRGGRNYSAGY